MTGGTAAGGTAAVRTVVDLTATRLGERRVLSGPHDGDATVIDTTAGRVPGPPACFDPAVARRGAPSLLAGRSDPGRSLDVPLLASLESPKQRHVGGNSAARDRAAKLDAARANAAARSAAITARRWARRTPVPLPGHHEPSGNAARPQRPEPSRRLMLKTSISFADMNDRKQMIVRHSR